MPAAKPGEFDRINAILAFIVALIAFFVYRSTVAPTFSYWDCGEFIACAHILGNPHPPGTPLFILIGRLFDLLPIGADIAYRVNLMSVVSATFTAMFCYLIVVRLVSSWYPDGKSYKLGRIIAYTSGIVGGLCVAFGRANWTNSVETEPRSLGMMLMMAILWLSLKWFDHRFSDAGKRILILVSFLIMLAVGVHLTVFLVVPIIAVFFSFKDGVEKKDWMLVSAFFAIELLLIIVLAGSYENYKIFLSISLIMFVALIIYMRNKINWPILITFAAFAPIMIGFYPFLFSMSIWLVASLIIFSVQRTGLWRLAALMVIAGAIGWSVHVYIPIRSSNHPIIDENTPSRNFRTFVNFLDRKQYGSMSMTERMFVRRGAWANQFGDHARMGFMRIMKEQFSNPAYLPLVMVIGLFGLGMLIYKKPKYGYLIFTLALLASVGLVLYMNFADGTRFSKETGDAYQEVRNRYYFFTPAFVMFGMALGLGIGAIMEGIRSFTAKMGEAANSMAVYASIILVLVPLVPAQANYFHNDRSRNRMAYDYAYNLLNSCEKNTILFTAGDNDTFPLWCMQLIYGIRSDVRVVNFSLLNTDWYTWQLKHFQNIPITLQDDQILWEPYLLPDGVEISKPVRPFMDRTRNRQAWLIAMPYQGSIVKVSSMMLDHIILNNKWKDPIYFSSAAGEVRESPLDLLKRCYREGLVLHLTPDVHDLTYRRERTDSLFYHEYLYDNLNDTTVAQSENTTGIAISIPEKALDYHSQLMQAGDSVAADSILNFICRIMPSYWRSRLVQRDYALRRGDTVRAEEIKRDLLANLHGFYNNNPDNIFFPQFLGMVYYTFGELDKSEKYLTEAWAMNHDKEHTFRALLQLYSEMRLPSEMVRVAQEYHEYQVDDRMANDILRSASALMQNQQNAGQPPANVVPDQGAQGQNPAVRIVPNPPDTSGK